MCIRPCKFNLVPRNHINFILTLALIIIQGLCSRGTSKTWTWTRLWTDTGLLHFVPMKIFKFFKISAYTISQCFVVLSFSISVVPLNSTVTIIITHNACTRH